MPTLHKAAATILDGGRGTVKFSPDATALPSGSRQVLNAFAARLRADGKLHVELIAHATGGPGESLEARRISLARAIAVRSYLIDKGIDSLRIDVRALGNHPEDGPVADQVDLMLVTQ